MTKRTQKQRLQELEDSDIGAWVGLLYDSDLTPVLHIDGEIHKADLAALVRYFEDE